MSKKINKLFGKKFFKFVLCPFVLLLLWIFLAASLLLTFDTSPTIISQYHGAESFDHLTHKKLLKGDKISGSFIGAEDNLGIVSIKFQTYIRPPYKNEGHFLFRLKEKGTKNWYYENVYRVGLIYDMPIFPFGFPKIEHSKNHTYYFELESLDGNDNNTVSVSSVGNPLTSKYQVPKSLLLHDRKVLFSFVYRKFVSSLHSTDVVFSLVIYALPLIFYVIWLFTPFLFAAYTLFVIVFLDTLLFQLHDNTIYLIVLLLWIVTCKIYSLPSKNSFFAAIVFLLIPPLSLTLRSEPTAEKAAIWAYIFVISAVLQALMELNNSKPNKKSQSRK